MKTYHQISPDMDIGKVLMFLTSEIPSYNLSGLNIKIPDKPLNRRILDEDTRPLYG